MHNIIDRAHLLGALFYYGPMANETQAIVAAIHEQAPVCADLSIDPTAWKMALQKPNLAIAWQTQFIGPQHLVAPPWGSVYLDHECIVFGESTLELRNFLQKCQLQLDTGRNEPEDHFGLLLLALVIFLQRKDIENAKILLAEYILPWGIFYLDLLTQHSEHPFISILANDARTFLTACNAYCQLEVPKKKIYWQISD